METNKNQMEHFRYIILMQKAINTNKNKFKYLKFNNRVPKISRLIKNYNKIIKFYKYENYYQNDLVLRI